MNHGTLPPRSLYETSKSLVESNWSDDSWRVQYNIL